jgi:hypothetical protein
MARITLSLDSATADQAREFLFAFQRALTEDDKCGLPDGGIQWEEPTVKVMGLSWTITTPPISLDHAAEMMRDFRPVTDAQLGAVLPGSTSGYSDTDECLTCGAHLSEAHDPSCASPAAVAEREAIDRA